MFSFFLHRNWKYSCLDLPRRSMPVANVEELYQSTKCVAQRREERCKEINKMEKKSINYPPLEREFHRA